MARKIAARLIVAVLLGIVTGYAVGKSLASDASEGQQPDAEGIHATNFRDHSRDAGRTPACAL